jgi:hypothetical protein
MGPPQNGIANAVPVGIGRGHQTASREDSSKIPADSSLFAGTGPVAGAGGGALRSNQLSRISTVFRFAVEDFGMPRNLLKL